MSTNKYSLVLASQSPRRKELLGWMDIPFEIISSDIPEESMFDEPEEIAEDLAGLKGRAVFDRLKTKSGFGTEYFPLVVASDTVVGCEGKIYGKPEDRNDAREMLKELSGQTHIVATGVYIGCWDVAKKAYRETLFSVISAVTFDNIADDILENYLKTDESLDKAGAYGIQGKGLTFIAELEGSYSNVVGFPLADFIDELRIFLGFDKDKKGEWRKLFHGA